MTTALTLRDLVSLAKDRRPGTSGNAIALEAQRAGFRVVATTLNHIGAGTYKSRPSAETVRAVAYLAGVSDDEAFTAAGLPIPGPPFADELPPDADELSPRSRKAVIEVIRAMLAAERGHQPPVEADLPLVIPVAADLEGEVSGQEPVTDHRQQVGV